MDLYSSRTSCSLILMVIGNIIEHHTEINNALDYELFSLFRVANRTFAATKGQMSNKTIGTMNKNEQDFEQQVRAHKATIYTVCYMFSKNQDEVADLYQECLINLWRSWPNFKHRSDVLDELAVYSQNVCGYHLFVSVDHYIFSGHHGASDILFRIRGFRKMLVICHHAIKYLSCKAVFETC